MIILKIIIGVGILVTGIEFLTKKIVYGITPITQRRLFKRCKNNVLKLLRKDWEISEFSHSNIKTGNFEDEFSVYVEIRNPKIREWTNDNVEIDIGGNIKGESLTEGMISLEEWFEKKRRNMKERSKA